MDTGQKAERRRLLALVWLAGLSLMAAVLLLGLGYFPTRAVGGPQSLPAMYMGVGIALLPALIALLPSLLPLGGRPRNQLRGLLTGMALRFILTLALLLAALLSGTWPRSVLAVWALLGYVTLLAVNVLGLARLARGPGRLTP